MEAYMQDIYRRYFDDQVATLENSAERARTVLAEAPAANIAAHWSGILIRALEGINICKVALFAVEQGTEPATALLGLLLGEAEDAVALTDRTKTEQSLLRLKWLSKYYRACREDLPQ